MIRRLCCLLIAMTVGLAISLPAFGQDAYYKGKTIRIIVGFPPGGGYDTHSRLLARHFGKHIAGNPTIVVDNMTGAGSLIAANYIYRVARPDGLTIGHFIGGLFLQQLLARPEIEFDAARFEYIGVPVQDNFAIGLSKASGINTVEKWMATNTPVKFGGAAPGAGTDDIPDVLKAALGLPIQLVRGYKGTADIRLAFNNGEVQGVSNAWESFKATWRKELESGDVIIVLQVTLKPHPDLADVPLALNYAKTDEARKLIETVVQSHGATVRPYVLPPATPKERVEVLRRAFMNTMKDPEFLKEASKARLDINPLDGSDLDRRVKGLLTLEPSLVAKLKEILK